MTDVEEHGDGERDDDVIAAEYVLGVLPAEERAAAADRLDSDRAFAMRVADWQDRLSGLNASFGEETPPARAWDRIADRLFALDPTAKPQGASLWSSLVFWRGLSVAAFATIVILGGTLLMRDNPAVLTGPELVASLSAEDSDAAFLVIKSADGAVRIARTGSEAPSGRSHELWAIVPDRNPVSLGLVTAQGTTSTALPADIASLPDDVLTLAVSEEPEGGAPEGQPTGPIVAVGQLQEI